MTAELSPAFLAKVKSGRSPCVVPFCERTFEAEGETVFICGAHWKGARRELRRRLSAARKRADAGEARYFAVHDRLWRTIIGEACLAACFNPYARV